MFRETQTKTDDLQKKTKPTAMFGALVSDVHLSKATSLARKGEFQAAENLLMPLVNSETGSAAALDLMARMRAQQGRFSEAETFWKRALEMEPNHETYLVGLRRIAKMQRRPLWMGSLLTTGVAVIAIIVVLMFGLAVREQIVQVSESLVGDVVQASSAAPAPAVLPPPPPIQFGGAEVNASGNTLLMRFNEGLFPSGANLSPEAETLLSKLGRQLQPHAFDVSIRIVGHTDDIPLTEGSIYRDNAELGLARAVAVAEYLTNYSGLPLGLFLLQSAGQNKPPYPNDSPANRLRNRTAVIYISFIHPATQLSGIQN